MAPPTAPALERKAGTGAPGELALGGTAAAVRQGREIMLATSGYQLSHRWMATVATAGLDGMGGAVASSLIEAGFIVVGVVALLLSAALGAAAWLTALRTKFETSGGVFARGFLGVSAVAAFLIGVACVALGVGRSVAVRWSYDGASALLIALLSLGVAFLAVEFGIAGTLYRRVGAKSGGAWPKVLSVLSFGIGALLGLVSLLGFAGALVSWLAP